MYTAITRILIVALVCLAMACRTTEAPEGPRALWLTELIHQLEQEAPANPPAKIYRYTYNDQEVYYLTGRCCDIPSKLFDKDGNQLCEPDGGITGKGDGRCPDFFEKRTNETIIWEDKRER
jgi:hypothetical protein